jgi:hypothetical protein
MVQLFLSGGRDVAIRAPLRQRVISATPEIPHRENPEGTAVRDLGCP